VSDHAAGVSAFTGQGIAYDAIKRQRNRLIPTPWPENYDTSTAKSDSLLY
jgi:hypothetical protein